MKVLSGASLSRRVSWAVIARLWAPLALNWLMMAVEGPILVGLVSRLPQPTESLAAFSVAFAIAMVIEAPIMMLLSAGAALARDRTSYERLWRFATGLNLPLSALMLLVGYPPVFQGLNAHLWKLPPTLAEWVAGAVWLLIPWPAMIGYRRLWQGILIRKGRSQLVAWGTVLRLVGMGMGAFGAAYLSDWPGTWIAAFALSVGVTVEMVAVRLWVGATLRSLPPPRSNEAPFSYTGIIRFYFPLLLTALLNVALTPLLTTLIARGQEPLLSLAAYPAVTNSVFLFSCVGVAYQEVVIVLLGTRVRHSLVSFAHLIGGGTALLFAFLTLPGLSDFWLRRVFAVPSPVEALAQVGLALAVPMPALVTYLAYLKGVSISLHRTRLNLWAAAVELGSVALLANILLFWGKVIALWGAILALIGARIVTLFFLLYFRQRLLSQDLSFE